MERHLGGTAEQLLDVLGIVDARQLHQNAILTLALNSRLFCPRLVDAPTDDLDRLVDRGLAPRRHGDVAVAQRHLAVAADRRDEIGVEVAEQLLDFALPPVALELVEIAQGEDNLVALDI